MKTLALIVSLLCKISYGQSLVHNYYYAPYKVHILLPKEWVVDSTDFGFVTIYKLSNNRADHLEVSFSKSAYNDINLVKDSLFKSFTIYHDNAINKKQHFLSEDYPEMKFFHKTAFIGC